MRMKYLFQEAAIHKCLIKTSQKTDFNKIPRSTSWKNLSEKRCRPKAWPNVKKNGCKYLWFSYYDPVKHFKIAVDKYSPYLISAWCCISYRTQSLSLLCESKDWFLYEMQYILSWSGLLFDCERIVLLKRF